MPEMSAVAKLVENPGAIRRTCGPRTAAAYGGALLLSRPEAARSPRIRQLSIAELLAESMRPRISTEESLSSLFVD